MEKPWGKAPWRHSFQQRRQTFGDREEIHVYMHTVLYKASTSEIPSLSVLMKGTGPVRLLMGHTSWKCSANSFCKKRKLNSKWAFSLPVCQVTIQCTVHECCSDCWTATVMRDISSERRVRGHRWAPLLSGKENKAALGIVNCSLIFSNMGKSILTGCHFTVTLFALIILFFCVNLWLMCPPVSVTLSLTWLSRPKIGFLSFFVDHWSFPDRKSVV